MKKDVINFKARKFKNNYLFVIIIIAVIIYIVWTTFQFRTNKHVTAYEVRNGSILTDSAYTGFAIRNEEVVKSKGSGFINFFVSDCSKVATTTNVYTLSDKSINIQNSNEKDAEEDSSTTLNSDQQASMVLKYQEFNKNYTNSNFSSVYTLKEEIDRSLEKMQSQSKKEQLNELVAANSGVQAYASEKDGFLLFEIDGYENVDLDSFKPSYLTDSTVSENTVQENTKVKTNDPIYKIISDNFWKLVISISDETAEELSAKKSVRVKFLKDNQTETASIEIKELNGEKFGILSFNKGMIRYASDRYLDIDLITEDKTGLKIPKSAVVKKAFYTVPSDYITKGGDTQEEGVLVDTGADTPQFQSVEIYFRDEETDMVYLDIAAFEKNATLIKPDSDQTYRLLKKKKLKGVYNINKGYALFKQIVILAESDEYYIIQSGNKYGLTNYDHIALNGSVIKENEVVY